jgi:CubicO group peptidase (beta-lactamase class C family)
MKIFKRSILFTLIIISIVCIWIILSGNSHLFLGISDTYLKGRTKPGVELTEIFSYREINATNPKPWNTASNPKEYSYSKEMQDLNTDYGTLAYLVIHNDSIVHERYFENYTQKTISNSFSIAKSILSVTTGIAVKQGLLKVSDPVYDYMPDLVQQKDTSLKIEHLLKMTSGMNFDEDYGNPLGFMAKAYYGSDLYTLLKGYHLDKKPDTEWEYLGGNNLLLSLSLEHVLDTNLSAYVARELWSKIGAETDARWILDHPNGHEKTFTGFFATARDFAKIGKLYLNYGNYDGTQIVDSSYVKASIQPVNLPDQKGENTDYYGYAWWLTTLNGSKVFYMRGILGQYVLCVPDKNLIVVRLGKDRMNKSNSNIPDDVVIYLNEALNLIQKN